MVDTCPVVKREHFLDVILGQFCSSLDGGNEERDGESELLSLRGRHGTAGVY